MEGITTLFVLAMGFLMCFIPLLLLKYAYALSQKNPTVQVSDTILIALLVLLATLNHFKAASLLRSKRCAC
ncbi:hypothetical protein ACNVED_16715 (plasmid) [Legionella sp. D16C41]|uniref:hypothetical protein n=1 Tax=Legionella sp. D16C41 TaxID=3402688 RepID=UPI003AF85C91